jgi:hypothetical protein
VIFQAGLHLAGDEQEAIAKAAKWNLQLIGDADPLGSVRRYGEEVLPHLR